MSVEYRLEGTAGCDIVAGQLIYLDYQTQTFQLWTVDSPPPDGMAPHNTPKGAPMQLTMKG
jgi:hypothetical protein